jgi:FtsH-binding integral membrane protein
VLSFIGVIVFAGLTVYDAQRLKAMALAFLMLLRFGGRRE